MHPRYFQKVIYNSIKKIHKMYLLLNIFNCTIKGDTDCKTNDKFKGSQMKGDSLTLICFFLFKFNLIKSW